jgi:spore maturation protein CgeB
MGTYAPDRQSKLEELLCIPARQLPKRQFIVAGPQYPASLRWPTNVKRLVHLEPKFHPPFYCSSRMTLNLTRADMVQAGYSPSVRLFEAAGCGTTILSDSWPGLSTFFEPGTEILLPSTWEDVVRYVDETDDAEIRKIGRAAQERVMSEHTSERRAREFEEYVTRVGTELQKTSF